MLLFYVDVRDGIMLLGAGVNLAVSVELHYVIGKAAPHLFLSLIATIFMVYCLTALSVFHY